jgi:tetratricopeptide (TPR) repeat protein
MSCDHPLHRARADLPTCAALFELALTAPAEVPVRRLTALIDAGLRLSRAHWAQAGTGAAEHLRAQAIGALTRGAQVLRAHGQHEAAIEYLERALALDPSAAECRLALAQIHRSLDRNAEILRSFMRWTRALGLGDNAAPPAQRHMSIAFDQP